MAILSESRAVTASRVCEEGSYASVCPIIAERGEGDELRQNRAETVGLGDDLGGDRSLRREGDQDRRRQAPLSPAPRREGRGDPGDEGQAPSAHRPRRRQRDLPGARAG